MDVFKRMVVIGFIVKFLILKVVVVIYCKFVYGCCFCFFRNCSCWFVVWLFGGWCLFFGVLFDVVFSVICFYYFDYCLVEGGRILLFV